MNDIEIRRENHGTEGCSIWVSAFKDYDGQRYAGWLCIRSDASGNVDQWLDDTADFREATSPLVTICAETF